MAPDSGIVVSNDYSDDAAVVACAGSADLLVLTADIIAPIVDNAFDFGRIAATNSISDIYAMGGTPVFALNLVFFPDNALPGEVLVEMLEGGKAAAGEAGVAIVGGHTVRGDEVGYGLSVTGTVTRDRLLTNRTARPGQSLVLTKALGTGFLASAIKKGEASAEEIAAAVRSMTTHNRGALELGHRFGATAATDVTGFGLLGHLRNILRGSELAATLWMSALPELPGARAHAAHGRIPGGARNNLEFVAPRLRRRGEEDELLTLLAADAQTSGGLLLTVSPEIAGELVAALRELDLPAARIGALAAPDADAPAETIVLDFATAPSDG
jgi:selenide,water dikinase